MNVLRDVFLLNRDIVIQAINARCRNGYNYIPGLCLAFSYTAMRVDVAYDTILIMLRYLDNGRDGQFCTEYNASSYDPDFNRGQAERDMLLAFLLLWVEEKDV